MLAYSYAANGDVARASCVKNWYFGKPGQDAPSARELALEIAIAEKRDAEKLQIEGVILGTLERNCGPGPATKP